MRARVLVLLVALLGLLLVPVTAHAAPGDVAITAPGANGEDSTPLVEGTSTSLAEVRLLVDGTEVVTLPPQPTGIWSYQLTTPLVDAVTLTAQAVVGGVVVDEVSTSYYVLPPVRVLSITSPQPGATVGPWTNVTGSTSDGVGADIEVLVDGVLVEDLVPYLPDFSGDWEAYSVDLTAIASGPHLLTARSTDGWGRTSEVTVPVVVDTDAPSDPVVASPAAGSVITTTTPTFTGTADPGTVIDLINDPVGDHYGTATVGADGTWSLTIADGLLDWYAGQRAEIVFLFRSVDPVGNVSASDYLTYVIDLRAGTGAEPPTPGGQAGPAPAAAPVRPELAETGPLDLLPATGSGLLLVLVGAVLVRRAHRA